MWERGGRGSAGRFGFGLRWWRKRTAAAGWTSRWETAAKRPFRGCTVGCLRPALRQAQEYRSDAYQVYDWLPANRHEVGKGSAVNRNEGLHSRLRDRINRLHSKTKGYSKSVAMLSDSIALVCLKLGLI